MLLVNSKERPAVRNREPEYHKERNLRHKSSEDRMSLVCLRKSKKARDARQNEQGKNGRRWSGGSLGPGHSVKFYSKHNGTAMKNGL